MSATLADPPGQVAVGDSRGEVLGVLQDSEQAVSAIDVARATGLHVNTARFHLEGLVADGLAARTAEDRTVPGRPRVLYAARRTTAGPRSYALLAEMLTGLVGSLRDAGPAAIEAGRAWGRHLVERVAPSEQIDADEAVARLNAVLDSIGFEPEAGPGETSGETELRLHHCPFREVAERHTDVVCAIHLGLMQGALGELRAPVEAKSLQPFVGPNLCLARLAPARVSR